MEDMKCVILNNKRIIHLNDKNDIYLTIISEGNAEYTFPISYPSAGYGGGSLSLSSSEKYLLFTYYSGQSEEAFILFAINTVSETEPLKLVYESGYLRGEAASYGYSDDEKLLIQGLPTTCTDWREPYVEEPETDRHGNHYFIFGAINVLDIGNKIFSEHIIHIYPSDDWGENAAYYDYFMSPKMINSNTFNVTMPWGEETLTFPLKDVIVIS